MSVEFEENKISGQPGGRIMYSRFQPSHEKPWIIRAILKTGLVKNESQAIYVLVFLVIICVIVSAYFFMEAIKPPTVKVDYSRFNDIQ